MQYTPEQAIQSDVKRNHHVEEKITKANQMLAMTRRNVRVVSKITRELTYNTFVQSQLWFSSPVPKAKLLRKCT